MAAATLPQVHNDKLNTCPACGKAAGELRQSEFGSRFPYFVKCKACGYVTEMVKLPGVAAKLWNESKREGKARARSK
jgi:uncharacterized Zn finger protein